MDFFKGFVKKIENNIFPMRKLNPKCLSKRKVKTSSKDSKNFRIKKSIGLTDLN